MRSLVLIIGLFVVGGRLWAAEPPRLVEAKQVLRGGGRVAWSPDGSRLAVDRLGLNLKLALFTMAPDGTGVEPLSASLVGMPEGQIGQPAWHPSGDWLVFQGENKSLAPVPGVGPIAQAHICGPGGGVNNDLYLAAADASASWALTSVKSWHGSLHPHFSPDGRQMTWASLVPGRGWRITLADFTTPGSGVGPSLSARRDLHPGSMAFYETHGFSPDGQRLLYCATPEKANYWKLDLFSCDLRGGDVRTLTQDEEWDEHAHYSPDGRWIVWTTSRGIEQPRKGMQPVTEYWIMPTDGTNQPAVRLTSFNHADGVGYQGGRRCLPSDFDWSPDGKRIAAYVQSWNAKGGGYRQELFILSLQ